MRTYSRKRTENTELENVTNICRLCLEKPNEFIPIYSDHDCNVYSTLAFRIMVCVGLEISNEERLPNIICSQCHKEVEKFYTFRKKCAKSYQKLKAHFQAVKAKECLESQNSMFTINSDGSILFRDRSNSLFAGGEPLVKLTKIFNDEAKATNSEVLHMFGQCGVKPENVSEEEYTIDSNQSSNKAKALDQETQPMINQSVARLSPLAKENLIPETKTAPDPEISEFLSTMLTELGILTRHGDGVIELGPKTSTTLELETKDGKNITFELIEEGEELENVTAELPVEERTTSSKAVEVMSLTATSNTSWRSEFKCPECGKVLASRSVLARHTRNVHKRARPHACPTCGKRFAQKEVMTRHLLVHQEKRPFECDKCPKSFTQRSALETHSRLHQPPQDRSLTLHQCPHCTKLFLYASGLSRHLLCHSNTQISCGECGRKFSDKSSLRRHQRTMRHKAKDDTENKDEGMKKDEPVPHTDTIQNKPVAPISESADTKG